MSAELSDATRSQQRAADPAVSVWVEASAGTGKTKVLTDRVLSLLLEGTAPQKLLCLTFTKAAAAEMANRIVERLGRWSVPGDAFELARDIATVTGAEPEETVLKRARGLFARVLDAPGGLKIQTIHAFCQSLLARFPVEAGLAPHFQVMDEASAAELLRGAIESVLADARRGPLGTALAILTDLVPEQTFTGLLKGLVGERSRLSDLIAAHGVDGLVTRLAAAIGLPIDETPEHVLGEAIDATPSLGLLAAIPLLEQGQSTDQKMAAAMRALIEARDPASFLDYCALFHTKDGEKRVRFITKAVADAHPAVVDLLEREYARVSAAMACRRAAGVLVASAALARLGGALLEHYRAAKEARMRLDYDDLILKARALLASQAGCAWVHYKLDEGIDHLLIDEAQDTNPEQWQVIAALAAEFFTGQGQIPRRRTIFAVGDPKQSIFSFQGADPDAFVAMREHFRSRIDAAAQKLEEVDLHHSFRSVHCILDCVDRVFAQPPASDGVADTGAVRHLLSRQGHAGLIELWPAAKAPEAEAPAPWAPPTRRVAVASPRAQVAQLIAATVRGWLDRQEPLVARGRPIRPGDILVLVRRRDSFVDELVRALKAKQIPVAGVDRMLLTEQLAVMDLVALGRFLLLPEDDLTLACLLKSPLVGLGEEDLYELAHDRGRASLWQRLRARAGAAGFTAAHDLLSSWLARADYIPPYELYARVLGAEGGRARLLARLGEESLDPIDEFLNQALIYERSHPPSLQGFLLWLERGALEVKRDGDIGERDEVRIMTVHGAKGLQAPIVFLPDTLQTPPRRGRPMWLVQGDGALGPLWSPRKVADDALTERLRRDIERAEDREHRRLLYVAMTRAEDRLYVTGWHSNRQPSPDCWYHLIEAGMQAAGRPEAFDFMALAGWPGGAGWRVDTPQQAPLAPAPAAAVAPPQERSLPAWVAAAPAEPSPPRPLAPSRPEEEPPVRSPLGTDQGWGFRRGRIVHRLLQSLPDLPPAERAPAARRFLAGSAHGLDAATQDVLLRETLAVLEDAAFAPLFAPGSRAEVPLVGRLGEQVIAGQIDRLAVTEREVLIVDYKTNRPPPRDPAGVPRVYLRQLAAYCGLLSAIYPGRTVRAALLWTDGPRLMPIAATLLEGQAPGTAPGRSEIAIGG